MPYSMSSEHSSPTQNDSRVKPSNVSPHASKTRADGGLSGCSDDSIRLTPTSVNK